jgi:polysaccharide export outer membrane protein
MRRFDSLLIAVACGAALLGGCTSVPYEDGRLKQIPVTATGVAAPTTAADDTAAGGTAAGGTAAGGGTAGESSAPAPVAYSLQFGDELDVKIADAPQYDQTVKVRPDGKINLNVIGSVYVAGRSPEDVESEIRERYAALAGSPQQREYLIHANDELDIKFPYYPQFNDQMRVRPDGKIQMQLAGTIQAEGVTPEELERELELRYARFLKEPELSVIVKTATSQMVRTAGGTGRGGLADLAPTVNLRTFQTPQIYVTGEVAKPGMIAYTAGLTLLQALAESGGNLPTGDVTKLVILRKSAAQTADIIRPKLTSTYRGAPTEDVVLQPYDVILLPPTRSENLAEALDRYVYKIIVPLKNSSFSYVWSRATTIY